ncbi:MAG TPA: ELWxxDGT repeat protein [Thermoanaerobaculia bacterium]|jgi:ELWxxDGT repeat protein|nr:ELWxxDGT repeat protein [Thermoanaerobaculia bacterium]
MLSSSLRRGALALSLFSIPSLGQADLAPRLVRDIDETSYAGSSSPRQFGSVEFGVAFTAFGGRELWISSERNEAYRRVLRREEIRQLGGPFYAAREAGGDWSFWLAVGNPYDTVFRAGGKPVGRLGAVYENQEWWDSPILFEAGRGSGLGLWTISINGPVELARPLPLPDGRLLRDFTPGRLESYFIARHPTLGTALWKTDGSKAGTLAVTAPSPGQTIPLLLAGSLRRRLLLAISGGEPELWWSDGSPRGLRPFLEIVKGREAATVSAARVVEGRAFLVIDDGRQGRQGRQLWTSDGTAAGTLRISGFAPDPLRQIDLPSLRVAGRWYFIADDGVHGRELWRTDGTRQGTQLVVDLCPGPCGSDPQDLSFRDFGGPKGVLFTAATPEGPRALWQTDGTPQGTSRLTSPGVEATTGIQYGSLFAARTAALGDELWITGGTPETTKLLTDLGLQDDSGSHPSPLGAFGNRLFFRTDAPTVENGLWTSDGTTAGTQPIPTPPVLDERGGLGGVSLGERMLFLGSTRALGSPGTLWSTDDRGAGFLRLTPRGVVVQSRLDIVGTRAVFFATDAEHGYELWATEGTPASTHLVVDLVPGPDPGGLDLVRFPRGDQLLFRGWNTSELWLTDGTAEGTRRLIDVDPLLAPLERSDKVSVAEVGGKLFFLGAAEVGGEVDLWVSDGTAAGTAPLSYADSTATFGDFFRTTNHLYFTVIVDDPESGFDTTHLWITDGTPAGTYQVPARPRGPFDNPLPPMPFGDRLVFTGENSSFWITDGTSAGTFPILDPRGNEISRYESHSIEFKNHLVFSVLGDDGEDGPCYVWNGAGVTVRLLENLSCSSFFAAGDRLYFNGFQPQTGAELWVLEEISPAPPPRP